MRRRSGPMVAAGGGEDGRRGKGAVEARRAVVAKGLLAHKRIREIATELAQLPAGERPRRCSAATVGRDALALRAEWAKLRGAAAEAMVGEDLARLEALEAVWWPKALLAEEVATDKVLAIQRQRAGLLGVGSGGGARMTVEAGAKVSAGAGNEAATQAAQGVRVVVEFVDDWRVAPGGAAAGGAVDGR